ncbi:hypothetical protein [Halodesulfovibrio sp.]|jgi:transcriptional regulator with XRE-family HTH domain|uniref:hypothetical protein n=1 Tax=Halodesulfovibrio sp. TaxID=1912772 RepID=UPI0025D97EA9|nr:hypothetical protein [Halodesulfovibrio sp.]MCT4627515.1 hypothetical protein [Halodesulfovibrio sp.]
MNKNDETAYAWSIIMQKIRSLRDEKHTLEEIGNIMGVRKGTVSRWLLDNENRVGGENTTFGDMLRYANALNIPLDALTRDAFFTTNPATTQRTPPQPAVENPDNIISFTAPEWMINALSQQAELLEISSQSLIKVWLADKLNTLKRQ